MDQTVKDLLVFGGAVLVTVVVIMTGNLPAAGITVFCYATWRVLQTFIK